MPDSSTPTPTYSCFVCLRDAATQQLFEVQCGAILPLAEAQELKAELMAALGPQGARFFEAWAIVVSEPIEQIDGLGLVEAVAA